MFSTCKKEKEVKFPPLAQSILMRLNVFNQVNLQRARGYQALVVSGCSGAVRLSLRSLLQWRAVTACTCFV